MSYYTIDGVQVDLIEFLRVNMDARCEGHEALATEEVKAILALNDGEFCNIGGGASGVTQVQRWAADGESFVERLRAVSCEIKRERPDDAVLFPGWGDCDGLMIEAQSVAENEQEGRIKEAARAIIAEGVHADDGRTVSRRSVAALLYYVADMLE